MNKYIIYIIYIIILITKNSIFCNQGVICVPIADLLGQPIQTIYPEQSVEVSYQKLPVCHKINAHYACPRIHQLLYNDIVDVISFNNDEVCISITQLFYTTNSSPLPQTTYWTAKKNVRLLSELEESKIPIYHLPEPINFQQINNLTESKNYPTLCLLRPHYDKKTDLTFSAGTRFMCAKKPQKYHKNIKVYATDYAHNKEVCIFIPAHKCYIHNTITPEKQIEQFVLLLKTWAHQNNSFIPYVWGGTSFVDTINRSFTDITKTIDNNTYSFYEYKNYASSPKSGFDCSGLISRAAQTCGMPYFCKNTTAIGKQLQPLQSYDQIINGDLILIKGHVMIVSDIKNNLLIEARGYSHGYGKVHEIPLNEVFDGIKTYDDLRNTFFEKKVLNRKDFNGKIRDTFDDWKIMKIMSIYSKTQ